MIKVHNENEMIFPAIALRGLSILPNYVEHFDVSRSKSVKAVEEAMKEDQKIFLVAQKDEMIEEPTSADMYTVGALWGFRDREELCGSGADVIAEKPEDLLRIYEERQHD